MKKMMSGMAFDGMAESRPQRASTECCYNQFTGHANDGRTVQMRQAPNRRGNSGECDDPISGGSIKRNRPPASVPDRHSASAPGMPQYRGVGGTQVTHKGSTSFNMGRGPTKGNQQ